MDKVKLVLKFIKKQHFWFLIGLVVVVCGYCWYSACGGLSADFTKNKSNIDTGKSTATKVASITLHPNVEHHTKEDELIAQRTKAAADAWRINYEKQGTDILTWPAELQQDFIDQVKDMRPIESKAKDIGPHLLERYRNYIQNELPKLAEMIGAAWLPKDSGVGGEGGLAAGPGGKDPAAKNAKPHLVVWNPADQEQWKNQHFDWSKKPNQIPTTKEVLYAQEDLWVLKALLTIIKKVNGNIDQPHLAGIKAIEFIHIGRDAATTEGTVVKSAGAAARGGAEGMGPGGAVPGGPPAAGAPVVAAPPVAGAGPGGPGMREGMGPGMALGGVTGEKFADNRYVDDKYKPLTEERLKAIGQVKDEADAHLAVAKRMPVRMRVRMDMRRVHDLLAECANSPLTVEVRQLRVNPEKASKNGNLAGGAGRGAGGEGVGLMPAGGRGESGGAAGTAAVSPYDGLVEIYGIIYIYNPVPSTLEQNLEGAAAAATAEAATGAAAKPADAAAATKTGAAATPPATGAATAPGAETKPAEKTAEKPAAEKPAAETPAGAPGVDDLKAPAAAPVAPENGKGAAAPSGVAEKTPAAAQK